MEIKSWRPEGWDKEKDNLIANVFTNPDRQRYLDGFEAGADAMLEALRKDKNSLIVPGDRKVHVKEEDGCSFAVIIKRPGTLVFIPDK